MSAETFARPQPGETLDVWGGSTNESSLVQASAQDTCTFTLVYGGSSRGVITASFAFVAGDRPLEIQVPKGYLLQVTNNLLITIRVTVLPLVVPVIPELAA